MLYLELVCVQVLILNTAQICYQGVCVSVCVCESPQINNLYLFSSNNLPPRHLETENFTDGSQAAILLYYVHSTKLLL
jgi:hypothetical protein